MFTRIVKLTISEEKTENFIRLFDEYKQQIRLQPGCSGLKLLRDKKDTRVFFTYSIWDKDESLDAYRHSELFEKVWGTTKTFFAEKAQAWSVNELYHLG